MRGVYLSSLILVCSTASPALERVHQNDVCQFVLEKLATSRIENHELRKGLKLAQLVFSRAIDRADDSDYISNMTHADRQALTKSLAIANQHLDGTDNEVTESDRKTVLDLAEPTVLGDVISETANIVAFLRDVEKLKSADSGFFSTDLAQLLALAAVFGTTATLGSFSHGTAAHMLALLSDFAAYLAIDKSVKCYEYFHNCDLHFTEKISSLRIKAYSHTPTRWYTRWVGKLAREQLSLALRPALKKTGLPSRRWATEFTVLSLLRHAIHRQRDFEATHFKVKLQMLIFTEPGLAHEVAELSPLGPQLAYFIELDPI